MSQEKPIVIIGSGIIGLFSAYYLNRSGHAVTVVDRGDGTDGCSFGNAGMIVPSHFIPLAAPGMIEKGLRWMFEAESPFYVKPRLSADLIRWGLNFYKAANAARVDKAVPALRDLGLFSKALYQEFSSGMDFSFSYEEKGLLMLCKNEHTLEEEAGVAALANRIGIEARTLSPAEVKHLEPELLPEVAGGVLFPGDAHLYPNDLIAGLKSYLTGKGVKFLYNTEITGVEKEEGQIRSLRTASGDTLSLSRLVLAAGSWSQNLAALLGIDLPIQSGKGYSVTKAQLPGKRMHIPSILVEARVAITPMKSDLIRFGGTMEIGGINDRINMNRVRGIIKAVPAYFPDYELPVPPQEEVWYGLRPCAPDGLPYIGRSQRYTNLVVASGHAMMGLSLAPATGRLVQEIVEGQKPSVDISLYRPERF